MIRQRLPQQLCGAALNMLTGIIHGYTTLQLRYAFSNPDKVRSDLCDALDTLLSGIQLKYTQ